MSNLKKIEKSVEDSCTQRDINRVWLVRNKKTIYKDSDDKLRTKKQNHKADKKSATEPETSIPLRLAKSILHPSKEGKSKSTRISKTPDENEYQESTYNGNLVDKLKEVKDIFNQTSNMMEWKKINTEALNQLKEENKIDSWEKAKDWALTKNNFFCLEQKIIRLAEQTKIFEEYTTLNDDFKQRLENKNHYKDKKKTSEKRPILESPSKWSDIEDEEERNKAFKEMYLERREQELTLSSPPEKNEDTEEDEKEEVKVLTKASPSKKKKGKKKKKKSN
ncbi:hypothetical protein GLOIN_2v1777001 [Rhizophagus irregularis DAOM 181602=DAOM 197198]|uniref:Uncharacterized protein n=2 Tax=Rhizophagus irregularis TaxID=588596 RepID=A0A2P4PVM5_RHIID|nr:hypothetical protein GLOIN_2v1777001 [Rhizophagus irregularis DAOM 181602=DAOM 197198]POG69432.1 hypothetical protein GLOIN_2v1777001 [Rhizophagus irregularis DAOM 181602=DAOM 197198]|eukprot:XP_025176298.1 hypothetical protein GLOIN_2v1777001 [Rhizophagus irregularis DAOM 181602=DAOM 197198]